MLGKYYRLRVHNQCGQTLTYNSGARVDIRIMPWKISSGDLSYGTVITDDLGFGTGNTIANGAGSEGDVQDNSTNLYMGGKGYFEVTTDSASSSGSISVYMEESDANGSDWPSDQADFNVLKHCIFLAKLDVSAADTMGKNFDI